MSDAAASLLAWKGRRVAATVLQWSRAQAPHTPTLSFHASLPFVDCYYGSGYGKARPYPSCRGRRSQACRPEASLLHTATAGVLEK